MRVVQNDCLEEELAKNLFDECSPEFDEGGAGFINETSSQMQNLLLNLTSEETNATVRRCQGHGWLAWKRITSSLNPRTLAFGVKAVSLLLSPGRIAKAAKADSELDLWEDRMAKLSSEYGQNLSDKVNVAVLYSMLPKDLQERLLDECAVSWDETPEQEAGVLLARIKSPIRNIAKSRRELSGPKALEVDAVWGPNDWTEWWPQ